MADENKHDRTEEATPKRREEARQQGSLAFSAELVGGLVLLAALVGLWNVGSQLGGGLYDVFRSDLRTFWRNDPTYADVTSLALRTGGQLALLLGPIFLIVVLAALAGNIGQVGWHITPERIEWDLARLSPSRGWSRIGSLPSIGKSFATLLKLAVLGVVAYYVIRGRLPTLTTLSFGRLPDATRSAWDLALRLAIGLTCALVLFGAIDYVIQRRRFEASLRMTRQEVKEEHRREEGDPLIRKRIRQLQRQRATTRMMKAVQKATVVVTNPTHYAVALKYEQGKGTAPVVVAKGTDHNARRIIAIARLHGVPLHERPVVARALFKLVPLDQEIPTTLFKVVAEIIAVVYGARRAA